MRGIDNQSTMGAWVGKLVLKGAAGGMKDWTYLDGTAFMHSEAEVKAVAQGVSAISARPSSRRPWKVMAYGSSPSSSFRL